MGWLRFLSRVAFICNLFFVFTVFMQVKSFFPEGTSASTIVIVGYLMAPLVNLVVNISYLVCFILRKPLLASVPRWLVISNIIFLLFQILTRFI
jgi:hypothetical protein